MTLCLDITLRGYKFYRYKYSQSLHLSYRHITFVLKKATNNKVFIAFNNYNDYLVTFCASIARNKLVTQLAY